LGNSFGKLKEPPKMKRNYLVSYDLREEGRNYTALIAALQNRFRAVSVLKSQWLLNSNLTASQLLGQLRMLTDANDGILITEMPGDADVAFYNLGPKPRTRPMWQPFAMAPGLFAR
jgi:hypothetical protein